MRQEHLPEFTLDELRAILFANPDVSTEAYYRVEEAITARTEMRDYLLDAAEIMSEPE